MTKTQGTKTLKFKYKSGTTAAGKDKYAQNTISKVDAAVSDEVIFAISSPPVATRRKLPTKN